MLQAGLPAKRGIAKLILRFGNRCKPFGAVFDTLLFRCEKGETQYAAISLGVKQPHPELNFVMDVNRLSFPALARVTIGTHAAAVCSHQGLTSVARSSRKGLGHFLHPGTLRRL